MTMTLAIENMNNEFSAYPAVKSESTSNGSYYKFYQSKLRQLLTQTRYRKEQEVRLSRQKQSRHSPMDNRLSEQRLHKEYMNHIRERSKLHSQDNTFNKMDDQPKRCDSVLSNSNRPVVLSITPTPISPTMESRSRAILKPKQAPVSPKQSRIISAPTLFQPSLSKRKVVPTTQIDSVEDTLSKANIHSFTEVTSSSSQTSNHKTYQHARQSIMDTIMLHLNTHIPSNISYWPTYEDIDNKFSSSISPTVYENFERIAV